ncbi:glycosyltransferase [Rubrobacter tropicus]|uniref:glycosyltransferase n=1 Tax=Rubrobacter tropicus TaxID=2653851 RepID=UPI00140B9A4F|nr:glycosyltransferase [Rubrobacter tropicus]
MSTVSVVIPALNEERLLGGLLSDLAAQTRPPDEVIVVDAGSGDGTVSVAKRFPFVEVLHSSPPVAVGRNAGGRRAGGGVLVFLDADARLSQGFLERFLAAFEGRGYDIACPQYYPHDSTWAVERFHDLFNLTTRAFQKILPSGAGTCIAVRGPLFREGSGFDPAYKFDDIELIRRLARGRHFGIIEETVFLSDRRYREGGVVRTMAQYSFMALVFALGRFEWADAVDYEIGRHDQP